MPPKKVIANGTLDHLIISKKRKAPTDPQESDQDGNKSDSPVEATGSPDTQEPEAEPPKKRQRKAPAKKSAKDKDMGFCSVSKKELGDAVKSSLALEKYGLQRTRHDVEMDTKFFRSFFMSENLTKPTLTVPETFDEDTPVVVAELSNRQAGELLGVSKVKGGNRMATTHLASMCVIFYPTKKKASFWVTV